MAANAHAIIRAILLGYLLARGSALTTSKRAILSRTPRRSQPPGKLGVASDPNNDGDDESNTLDSFLDKQIFDPDAPSNDNNWFANLVKDDYDSAEALYVGVIGIFGVILSQELLRMVKYGSAYTPFGSPGGGNLF